VLRPNGISNVQAPRVSTISVEHSGEVDRLSTHRTTREALWEIGTFLYRLLLQDIFPNVMLFLISKHFQMSTKFFKLRYVLAQHSELVDELVLGFTFVLQFALRPQDTEIRHATSVNSMAQ
jgi:hypothetical protein